MLAVILSAAKNLLVRREILHCTQHDRPRTQHDRPRTQHDTRPKSVQ